MKMDNNLTTINVASWNCRGLKSKTDFISLFLETNNIDIFLLQETWLRDCEEPIIAKINSNYDGVSISSMDDGKNSSGRPFGGLAMLWRKELSPLITSIKINQHMASLNVHNNNNLEIINCYLPTATNREEQSDYFGKIASTFGSSSSSKILFVGDFNVDPVKHESYNELRHIMEECELVMADIQQLPPQTFTYVSDNGKGRSWIDHVITTQNNLGLITDMDVLFPTPSDHGIVKFKIDISNLSIDLSNTCKVEDRCRYITWNEADQGTLNRYYAETEVRLARIVNNIKQLNEIDVDSLYEEMVDSLKSAEAIAAENGFLKHKKRSVPGWNYLVKSNYDEYRLAYYNYKAFPSAYCLWVELNEKKRKFKLQLRKCVRQREMRVAERIAETCIMKDDKNFWSIANSCKNTSFIQCSNKVEGSTGEKEIAKLWYEHYSGMFVNDRCIQDLIVKDDSFKHTDLHEIELCCRMLKKGKSKGPDMMCIENVLYAHPNILVLITILFDEIFRQSILPSELTRVRIVPILKKKGLNISKIGNYRPIALATCLSKLLETIILHRIKKLLHTSDNQFGFKEKVGCETAVFSLKQAIEHYSSRQTPTYIVYLDATKAFDRVDHRLLIEKLKNRRVPSYIVNLVINWFDIQRFDVKWGKLCTQAFPVRQSVRQGGVLSAYLFAIYMDDLSCKLNDTSVGARINSTRINHLIYADDFCLISNTMAGLKILLNQCSKYAEEHNIIFNPSKTQFQCYTPSYLYQYRDQIELKFGDNVLKHVDCVKYLGYLIGSRMIRKTVILCDNEEITKRKSDIYAKANMISSLFSRCTEDTKKKLFVAYISNIYCCSTWQKVIGKRDAVFTAYNNALRKVFRLSRMCSASEAFVMRQIDNMHAVLRGAAHSMLQRLSKTENTILKSLFQCQFSGKHLCNVAKVWAKLLFYSENDYRSYVTSM